MPASKCWKRVKRSAIGTNQRPAALATCLCSDAAAAQITGANLPMDGGWTAQ